MFPNFSEGRDLARIDALASAVRSVQGVLLLDRTSDWDHHRSVLTFAGSGPAVAEAAVRVAAEAVRSIDLTQHRGVHPRLGALDVLPFVPLRGVTLEECAALARHTAERIYREVNVPAYLYGAAALRPDRVNLENVRRGGFEGLTLAAPVDPAQAPDIGGPSLHPTAGAVIVGARKILIAFNIVLQTDDLAVAKSIARQIRASSGGFPAVKALGLPLSTRNLVQVSMNLTDFEQTPLHTVFQAVSGLAAAQDVAVEDSEVIGLLPQAVIEAAFAHFLKLPAFKLADTIEHRIASLTGQIFE